MFLYFVRLSADRGLKPQKYNFQINNIIKFSFWFSSIIKIFKNKFEMKIEKLIFQWIFFTDEINFF